MGAYVLKHRDLPILVPYTEPSAVKDNSALVFPQFALGGELRILFDANPKQVAQMDKFAHLGIPHQPGVYPFGSWVNWQMIMGQVSKL